ncbi:MAG: methyltransferase domain-containing protein [Gemmatimonas sp.]|nr:methyltransferase domain-containing protein [Gemmatimonas sp.]
MPNEFPAVWFDTFLSPTNAAPVDRELDFIRLHLPVSEYPRLLDVPCGIGRHSGPLAAVGYEVVGIDKSGAALAVARQQYPDVEFRELDMFALKTVARTFDGVLCLWQSFGYGDSEQNRGVLADMHQLLRPGGRILLDIYNAEAAALLPPLAAEQRRGRTVWTRRVLTDRRLLVELEYSDVEEIDRHEWEIFNPSQIKQLAAEVDLDTLVCCAWFDPAFPPNKEHLRMQLLLERLR